MASAGSQGPAAAGGKRGLGEQNGGQQRRADPRLHRPGDPELRLPAVLPVRRPVGRHRRRLVAADAERSPRAAERVLTYRMACPRARLRLCAGGDRRVPADGRAKLDRPPAGRRHAAAPAIPDLGWRPRRHARLALDWRAHCRGHRPCVSCRARTRRRARDHRRQQHPQSEGARRRCASARGQWPVPPGGHRTHRATVTARGSASPPS